MRDAAFACIRRVGVETGGSNVQFAVDPETGDMVVIEMNPRVSRSSALASKATGSRSPRSPPASPSATRSTRSPTTSPEDPGQLRADHRLRRHQDPALGLREVPRHLPVLGTQMQSVGEAMAIGRTFPESLQKALRSLEQGRLGLNCDPARALDDARRRRAAGRAAVGTPDRIFQLEALRRGVSVDAVARGHGGRPVVPRPDARR
jgi:carbamoyl-phosphate synthase large subunit